MPEKFAKIWPFFKVKAEVKAMSEKWEFGQTKKIFKYQVFFTKNKSVFMTYGQIPLRNGLNFRRVSLKTEE